MQICKCVCRYKNDSERITACDVRLLPAGNVITLTWKEFTQALRDKTLQCNNMGLNAKGIPHVNKKNTIPIISRKLTPKLTKEVDEFVQMHYMRYKFAGVYTNLESVFDSFLAMKHTQHIIYSPLTQFCIYEYMKYSRIWDVDSTYREEDGVITLVSTKVREGIFVLRCWVRQLCGDERRFGSPFPVTLGRLKVINQSPATHMNGLFSSIFVEQLDLSEFATKNVVDMRYMFFSCKVKELDLRSFDTSKVTNMERMFTSCSELVHLDISSFDTRRVTNTSGMFFDCNMLRNVNLCNFDTSNVTNMRCMFRGCDIRTWDISHLDTQNVTSMADMFYGGYLDSAQLRNLNTSSVTSFSAMFKQCRFVDDKCDLRSFDTRQGIFFFSMFGSCKSLKEVNLGSFSFDKANDVTSMFADSGVRHLEINFGFHSVTHAASFCTVCDKLEVLTIKGLDFLEILYIEQALDFCDKLRQINLECRNLQAAHITKFRDYKLPSLKVLNLKGSDSESIEQITKFISKSGLAIKVEY